MRRRLFIPFAMAAMLIGLLLPAASLARSTDAASSEGLASAPTTTSAPVDVGRLRMGCAIVDVRVWPGVACHWAAADADTVRGYKLFRSHGAPGAHPRHLIAKIPADGRLRNVDRLVRRGHLYTYVVVAIGKDGSRIAVGGPVAVRIPARHHALRFVCANAVQADQSGVVCRWSKSHRPAAIGYVLYRSVDGAPRTAIHMEGLNGPRQFFDTDVTAGQKVRYVAIAVDGHGHRVGRGGPIVIRIRAD